MMEKKFNLNLEVTVSYDEETHTLDRLGLKGIGGEAICKLGKETKKYSFVCYLSKNNEMKWQYRIETPREVREKIENAYTYQELAKILRNT